MLGSNEVLPDPWNGAYLICIQLQLLRLAVVARIQGKQGHQQHCLQAQSVLQRPPAQGCPQLSSSTATLCIPH